MLNKAKADRVRGPKHDASVPLHELETSEPPKYAGLCEQCRRAVDCTYPREELRPVRFCEEFDGAGPRTVRPATRAPKPDAHAKPAEATPWAVCGLCRTCTRLSTCTFPKPVDGVWHCEEFE